VGDACLPFAFPTDGLFLPQRQGWPRIFSNFLPIAPVVTSSGQSRLLLRFDLCHKHWALGNECKEATGTGGDGNRRDGQAIMIDSSSTGISRRGLLGVFAATIVVAAPTYSNAFSILRGAGDIRRIRMYSGRTGEQVDTIYWIEGEYIKEVMKEINHFMRDWRSGDKVKIDNRTVDIMAASHRLMDVTEPYMMLSGYRSAATNAMLRSKSRGVARDSLHVKGQAADLRLKSRSVGQMARAAEACSSGGVGRYSRSNFVHMDCGPVRSWGG